MNLRDTILAAKDIETKLITVKKWGGAKLLLSGLSGAERNQVYAESSSNDLVDYEKLGYNMFVAGVRDPATGEKIFTAADIEALKKKDWATINRIYGLLMKLSGIGAGDMEEAEKN
jgi:hypothetical protein